MWNRIIWLFILFLLGKHLCFPSSPRYIELADSADTYIAGENWIKAENKIIEALKLEPANFSNSLLLANLGIVQSNQGKYAEAIESLSLGLNIAPSSTVLLNNRAHVYISLDSINAAKKDLDRSLEIDSIQEWTLQTRAFIYLQEQHPAEAKKIFEKLTQFFPENTSALRGLGIIAADEGDFNTAIRHYKTSLNLKADDEETREAYIMLLIQAQDYSEARKELKNAIEYNPENPMYYLLRGYLHRLNFRPDEALADKKLAIAKGLDPHFVTEFIP